AYLTWRFVENPFRSHNRRPPAIFPSRAGIFAGTGTILVAFIGIGAYTHASGGFPQRDTLSGSSYEELDLDQRLQANYGLDSSCRDARLTDECQSGDNPRVLLWGDSYAMHLGQALLHSPDSASFMQATKSACGPFMDISIVGSGRFDTRFAKSCINFNDRVIEHIRNRDIDLVIASSAMRTAVR